MKKIIIGICSLLLAVLLGCLNFWNLQNICKKSIDQGERILASIEEGDFEKTNREIYDFLQFYDKKQVYLGVYLNHSEIEDIDILFYELEANKNAENPEALLESTEEIIYRLKHVKKSEIPNFKNIF